MTAAIIELDALADPVWTTAKNHDPFFVGLGWRFVFVFVGRIVVRRVGFEFSSTGVD